MKRKEIIPDPFFRPIYKSKSHEAVEDPAYKPEYKAKVRTLIQDPSYKPKFKVRKTLLETIMAPWRSLSVLDAESTSISMPSIRGPPEVIPPPIHKPAPSVNVPPSVSNVKVLIAKAPKPIPIVKQDKAPLPVEVVPEVVPGPEPGSRAWKKQQFKLTNFI